MVLTTITVSNVIWMVQQMQGYGERVSFSCSVGLAFFSQDSNQYYVQTVGRIKQKLYVTVSICTVYLLVKKLATGHQRRVAQQLVEAPSRLA